MGNGYMAAQPMLEQGESGESGVVWCSQLFSGTEAIGLAGCRNHPPKWVEATISLFSLGLLLNISTTAAIFSFMIEISCMSVTSKRLEAAELDECSIRIIGREVGRPV